MITLHQYHMSPYNEKVRRALHYKGLDYSEHYWLLADRGKVRKLIPPASCRRGWNG